MSTLTLGLNFFQTLSAANRTWIDPQELRRWTVQDAEERSSKKLFGGPQKPEVRSQKQWSKFNQVSKRAAQGLSQVIEKASTLQQPPETFEEAEAEATARSAAAAEAEAQGSPKASKRRRSRRCALRRKKKAKARTLEYDERRNNFHNSQIIHRTNAFNSHLNRQFGWVADTSLSPWRNARNIILNTPPELYFNQPSNKSVFIFTNRCLPPGTHSLLNLGLKFCIRANRPTNKLDQSFKQFTRNARIQHWLLNLSDEQKQAMEDGDDTPFNSKLYLQNPWWDPPEASEEVEAAIANFQATLTAKQRVYQIKSLKPNLTRLQLSALRALKNHDHLIVVEADKNMGVAIFDRDTFIKQVLDEHLGNAVTYQNITNNVQEATHDVGYLLNKFIENHGSKLPKKVITFMLRSFDTYGDKIAPFRATAKVHKNPVKLRPVVAKCGTAIEALSKWLDLWDAEASWNGAVVHQRFWHF